METGLEGDSIVDSYEEEKMGCLEKVPGWMAKLQEPFLPDIELRLSQKSVLKSVQKSVLKSVPKSVTKSAWLARQASRAFNS